jgi:ATPase complex subunit ATP10
MVPEWTDPFRQAFSTRTDWTHRAKVFQLVVHEGRILSFLQSFIARSFRKQTVAEFHPSLLLYFTKGDDEEYQSFRDVLRMHNNKTAYVFLLDGVGKVRFAGSGRPSPEEIHRLIELAKSMVPALK